MRQRMFFCDEDFEYFICLLAEYSRKHALDIAAYCLMLNQRPLKMGYCLLVSKMILFR